MRNFSKGQNVIYVDPNGDPDGSEGVLCEVVEVMTSNRWNMVTMSVQVVTLEESWLGAPGMLLTASPDDLMTAEDVEKGTIVGEGTWLD